MKISDLVRILEDIKADVGDVPVSVTHESNPEYTTEVDVWDFGYCECGGTVVLSYGKHNPVHEVTKWKFEEEG